MRIPGRTKDPAMTVGVVPPLSMWPLYNEIFPPSQVESQVASYFSFRPNQMTVAQITKVTMATITNV